MREIAKWTGLVALILMTSGSLEAQRPDRARMEQQVRARFQALVERELALDDATAAELREVVEAFRGPRRELAMRQMRLQRRMRSTGTLLSDGEAREVLAEMQAVREEEAELLEEEQEALLGILSPGQAVRFYTLREELGRRIRSLRSRRPGDGGARQGGPRH